jgi:hypothetical protein
VSLRTPSSSRSPYHDPHRTIYYLEHHLGRFAGLKHRQLARQVGVIITTGRIRRTLINKINQLVDSPRFIGLARVKAESIFLRHASGCLSTSCRSSRGSSSTTSPTSRVHVPRLIARLVTRLIAPLVVDYFAYTTLPRYLGMSRGSSRDSSSTIPPAQRVRCLGMSRGSLRRSSLTTPMSLVRVPRHVARLVACARRRLLGCVARLVARHVSPLVIDYSASQRLVVDYFGSAACPGASARRAARRRLLHLRCMSVASVRCVACLVTHHRLLRLAQARRRLLLLAQAHRRLLRLRRASGCLGTSHGSSLTTLPRAGSLLITSPTPVSGCLGTSRSSSRVLSSTTSPMLRVWVPRQVARLVSWLIVSYFAYVARPGASARRAARHAAHRRLLRAPRLGLAATLALLQPHGVSRLLAS